MTAPARTPDRFAANWLPAALSDDHLTVELVDAAGALLLEPFLRDSIERMLGQGSAVRSVPVSDLLESGVVGLAPSGLIFHVSRCGSTLLANMLSQHPQLVVAKEPGVLGAMLDPLSESWTGVGCPPEGIERLYRILVDQFVRFADAQRRRLVLKLSSASSPLAGRIAGLWPDCPVVFVVRDPEPVVASLLHGPPEWSELIDHPREELERRWPALAMTESGPLAPEVFYAGAWASAIDGVLNVTDRPVLVCPYDRLVAEPEGTLAQVARHLEIGLDGVQIEVMRTELGRYAKDVRRRPWQPDVEHRRPSLTPGQQVVVDDVTRPARRRLAARLR